MEMYKIILKSDTAFFRNEVTSTSYQESFNCPPLSTIHGLIASAYGEYRYDINVGYIFNFEYKTVDFELILRKESKHKKLYKEIVADNRYDRNDILRGCFGTIPVKREILFNCTLTLYVSDKEVAESFNHPYYSLLFGRSEDLAKVIEKPKMISLPLSDVPVNFGKSIIPFEKGKMIPGRLSKLNIKISEDYPRKVEGAGIFNIVDKIWENQNLQGVVNYDSELNLGVYIHTGKINV